MGLPGVTQAPNFQLPSFLRKAPWRRLSLFGSCRPVAHQEGGNMTRRSITLVACVLVGLTVFVFEGTGCRRKTADTHAQDLAEIEKLHSQDIAATSARD